MEQTKTLNPETPNEPCASTTQNLRDPEVDARIAAHRVARPLEGCPRKLTAELLMEMRGMLSDEQKVGAYIVFDSASFPHVIGNNDLVALLDPVAKRETLLRGMIGVLLGMDVLSDCYRHPEEQEVPAYRIYVMAGDGSTGYAVDLVH